MVQTPHVGWLYEYPVSTSRDYRALSSWVYAMTSAILAVWTLRALARNE